MTSNTRYLLLLPVLLGIGMFQANGQQTMRLSDCIDYALANSPDIRNAQLLINDAEWRIKESKAAGYPQLTGAVDYQYFLKKPVFLVPDFSGQDPNKRQKVSFVLANSLNGTVNYNQLLFSSSYLIGLKAAKYYREYVQVQYRVTQQTLRNQVTDAYLPAVLLSENMSVIDKNIRNLQELMRETREITKAGFAEQLDVDRLDLSISSLQTQRENLLRQQEMAVNGLKLVMGYPISQPLTLADSLNTLLVRQAEVDLSTPVDLNARPEYLQLQQGQLLNQTQLELYQKAWVPTLAGFVQYQAGWQGDKLFSNDAFFIPQSVAGLSLRFSLWDGGTTTARKHRAAIAIEQVETQRRMLENAINLEVENARKMYQSASAQIRSQQRNVELAQRIYQTTEIKYKAGIGSSFELVTAEQELFRAQQAMMQAQYDLLNARVTLRRSLGIATPENR